MCASKDGFPLALITLFGQMLAVESLFCMGPGVVPALTWWNECVCVGGILRAQDLLRSLETGVAC